jgi:hypothetical protein
MKFILSLASIVILSFGTSSLAFAAEVPATKAPVAKVEAVTTQEAININTADVQEEGRSYHCVARGERQLQNCGSVIGGEGNRGGNSCSKSRKYSYLGIWWRPAGVNE